MSKDSPATSDDGGSAPVVSGNTPSPGRTIALVLAVALGFALLAQFTYLVPDSAGYLSWGRSLLWDADLDFANEYARFGMIEQEAGIRFGAATPAGHSGNPFGMGTGLLWIPFLAIGALLAQLFKAFGADVALDGFGTASLFAAHLGTWTFVFLAWLFVDATLRMLHLPARQYRLVVATAFLTMPLPYYVLQLASYSHAASVFVVSVVVYLSVRWQADWNPRRALLLGAVIGVAGLVRVQNLAFAWFPLCLALGALRQRHISLRVVFSGILGVLLTFLPQVFAWTWIYGSASQIPQGSDFVRLSWQHLTSVLFATRHGLLTTAPILLVAIGALLVRMAARSKAMVWAIAGCFVLQWLSNAAPLDWWGGWSFGARRFSNLIPLVAICLAFWDGGRIRIILGVLIALNLVQWLRLAMGSLPGEADPGWNGLWGGGFLAFLPEVPRAIWNLLQTPWDQIAIIIRPAAQPLRVRPDPLALLLVTYALWLVLLVPLVRGTQRWLASSSRQRGSGNSPAGRRV